jgi:hypothetical protein
MSIKRQIFATGAAAAALAIIAIAAAVFLLGAPVPSSSTSLTEQTTFMPTSQASVASGQESYLVIQLTDPPQVPVGTTSLNLTYSALTILVGEPTASGGEMTTQSIGINPPGGSATLDLLDLQNVSQTVGTANLPDGSVLYSVTFSVTGISIDVSGQVSPVSLATGTTFTVTLSGPQALHGTNLALIRLEPVVVSTPTGYSLVPSSVGVIRTSEGAGEGNFGFSHHLSSDDFYYLNQAEGIASASLTALSVSGSTTTVQMQIKNTGTSPLTFVAVELQGNFTFSGCQSGTSTSTSSSEHPFTGFNWCLHGFHSLGVIFVPVVPDSSAATTTTSGGCTILAMEPVGSFDQDLHFGGLNVAPGACVDLTFSGTISYLGQSLTVVPSTLAGQSYTLRVTSFFGGNVQVECTLPLGPSACTMDNSYQ